MNIGRRRIVLIEKLLPVRARHHDIPEAFKPLITPIFSNTDLFVKNRFAVELERSDGIKIEESRICGFKLDSHSDSKILKIKTFLHVQEWLNDYEKVIIARISLLDAIGNEINSLDLDIIFDGYTIECDYGTEGFMTPHFSYKIVGA